MVVVLPHQQTLESPQTLTGALSPRTTVRSFYQTDMKLFFSLAMALALSFAVNAATVSFSGITSTNAVKTNDLLLVDSALGGTNYVTRTATIATLQSALSIPTVPTGLVSNSVAQSGLLAVDATKTNGVAATVSMVNSAIAGGTLISPSAQVSDLLIGAMAVNRGTLTHAGGYVIVDFAQTNRYWSCSITGNVTFVPTNSVAGKWASIDLYMPATNCMASFTLPAGSITNYYGGIVTNLTANTVGWMAFYAKSSDTNATKVAYIETQ